MSSDSKKTDKFLINVVPTFEPAEDSALEFNTQFSTAPEEFVQKYRLRCMSSGSSGGSNLLSASGGGTGSVGAISSPVAPNIPVNGADSMSSITSSISIITDEKQQQTQTTSSKENLAASPPSALSVSSLAPAPASVQTLQKELKDSRAEIDRLKLLLVRPPAPAVNTYKIILLSYCRKRGQIGRTSCRLSMVLRQF